MNERRSYAVQVMLIASNKADDEHNVYILSEENDWTVTVEMDVYADGVAVAYSVEEVSVPDQYTVAYSTDEENAYSFIVTNTVDPVEVTTEPEDDGGVVSDETIEVETEDDDDDGEVIIWDETIYEGTTVISHAEREVEEEAEEAEEVEEAEEAEEAEEEDTDSTTVVKTGESSFALVMFALAIVSGLAFIVLAMTGTRKSVGKRVRK